MLQCVSKRFPKDALTKASIVAFCSALWSALGALLAGRLLSAGSRVADVEVQPARPIVNAKARAAIEGAVRTLGYLSWTDGCRSADRLWSIVAAGAVLGPCSAGRLSRRPRWLPMTPERASAFFLD
jgi:hypothetical protein